MQETERQVLRSASPHRPRTGERLEGQAQRHLNLSRASNGFISDAETAEAGTRVQGSKGLTARRRGW